MNNDGDDDNYYHPCDKALNSNLQSFMNMMIEIIELEVVDIAILNKAAKYNQDV